jgi:hypothetical protein
MVLQRSGVLTPRKSCDLLVVGCCLGWGHCMVPGAFARAQHTLLTLVCDPDNLSRLRSDNCFNLTRCGAQVSQRAMVLQRSGVLPPREPCDLLVLSSVLLWVGTPHGA